MAPWNKEVVIRTIEFPRGALKTMNDIFEVQHFERLTYKDGLYVLKVELSKTQTNDFLKKLYNSSLPERCLFAYYGKEKRFGIARF